MGRIFLYVTFAQPLVHLLGCSIITCDRRPDSKAIMQQRESNFLRILKTIFEPICGPLGPTLGPNLFLLTIHPTEANKFIAYHFEPFNQGSIKHTRTSLLHGALRILPPSVVKLVDACAMGSDLEASASTPQRYYIDV